MALLSHLRTDLKLKLISKLTDSLSHDYKEATKVNNDSWKNLFGVWSDTDDNLVELVKENRMPNREIPSFDK